MIVRKLVILVLALCVSSCNVSETTQGLTEEVFAEIRQGDPLSRVFEIVGKPLRCYVAPEPYPGKGLPSGGLYRFIDSSKSEIEKYTPKLDRRIVMEYSLQKHSRLGYTYSAITLVGGKVIKTEWREISEF